MTEFTERKKKRAWRIAAGVLLLLLAAGTVSGWLYMRYAVPDRLNLVVREEEQFQFYLPSWVTLESESEEVSLGNRSNIPSEKVRVQAAEPVLMYGS